MLAQYNKGFLCVNKFMLKDMSYEKSYDLKKMCRAYYGNPVFLAERNVLFNSIVLNEKNNIDFKIMIDYECFSISLID